MRRLLVALGLMGLISDAFAADYTPPILRGSDAFVPATPNYFRWEGFYAGGQVTYGNANGDFSTATDPLIVFGLRQTTIGATGISQWQVLGDADTSAAGFGGFAGYNTQWDDLIFGVELNYTRSSFGITSPNTPIARSNLQASDGPYNVAISGSGTMNIEDFAVLRGRAGWVAGNFLPYATVGFAVGRADLAVSSTVVFQNVTSPLPNPVPGCALTACESTSSQNKTSAFMYGYAVGGGLDVALTRNIFARGEYEYIQWAPIWQITSHINITRLGVGLKF